MRRIKVLIAAQRAEIILAFAVNRRKKEKRIARAPKIKLRHTAVVDAAKIACDRGFRSKERVYAWRTIQPLKDRLSTIRK